MYFSWGIQLEEDSYLYAVTESLEFWNEVIVIVMLVLVVGGRMAADDVEISRTDAAFKYGNCYLLCRRLTHPGIRAYEVLSFSKWLAEGDQSISRVDKFARNWQPLARYKTLNVHSKPVPCFNLTNVPLLKRSISTFLKKRIAATRFDRVTSGLWAPRATTAPCCLVEIVFIKFHGPSSSDFMKKGQKRLQGSKPFMQFLTSPLYAVTLARVPRLKQFSFKSFCTWSRVVRAWRHTSQSKPNC